MRTASILIAVLLLMGLVMNTRAVESAPAAVKVVLADYEFRPVRITARPGQRVTITLVNTSAKKKPHEFMIGREVRFAIRPPP